MSKRILAVLLICSTVLLLHSCTGIIGGVDTYGSIVVSPKVVRTSVGQEVNLKYDLLKSPSDASLKLVWTTDNEDVINLDSEGKMEVIGLGKATVIASVYDEKKNHLDSDTAVVYSEAKKLFTLEGSFEFHQDLIDVDPESEGIFMATRALRSPYENSMYWSDDLGESWDAKGTIDSDLIIRNLDISGMNSDHLVVNYLDRNIGDESSLQAMGLLVSTNNGASWIEASDPFDETEGESFDGIWGVSYSTNDENTLFAHVRLRIAANWPNDEAFRLYKSTNLGASWTQVHTFSNYSNNYFTQSYSNPQVMYSRASYNGGFVSLDGGVNWKFNDWPDGLRFAAISASGVLYGILNSDGENVLMSSSDHGETWQIVLQQNSSSGIAALDTYSEDVFIAFDWSNRIWASTDRGDNWAVIGPESGNPWKMDGSAVSIHIVADNETYIEVVCMTTKEIWKLRVDKELYF